MRAAASLSGPRDHTCVVPKDGDGAGPAVVAPGQSRPPSPGTARAVKDRQARSPYPDHSLLPSEALFEAVRLGEIDQQPEECEIGQLARHQAGMRQEDCELIWLSVRIYFLEK